MKGRKGSRSRARERALQALYQVDLASADPIDALAHAWKAEDEPPDEESLGFSEELVRGVCAHRPQIDQRIEETSHHWRVERMAKVDRNVLRLAVFELLHQVGTPRKVVLNEAVELAKKYGSEESGAFINGILDKIAASLGKETGA
ncbi:MAG: transcription antitermination factor NusB [Deltaproteobacteria bacterium]|nr:transcription antitermination factor NusB [Deltaproteobacteria bacterium]